MLYLYIGCFTFGAAYSIFSLLLGGHSADHGGVDHVHGADSDLPSPLNPIVIASAVTAFGAVGLISKLAFKMGDLLSSVFALGFAGIVGAAIFFGIVKLMYGSQSDSTFSQNDLVGMDAEVTIPIPCKGMGEIACSVNGTRYSMAARDAEGGEIQRGEPVKIKEIAGNTAVVGKKITIDSLGEYGREENCFNEELEYKN